MNLRKELRLVQGNELLIIASLFHHGCPVDVIAEIFNYTRRKIYRIVGMVNPVDKNIDYAVKRALAYSCLDYIVYKVASAIVITTDDDIPPKRFKAIPARMQKHITNFMENGMYERVNIEDTVYADKPFSRLLTEY